MNSNDIYVSLDIGTSTVKLIIGEMVNDSLNIIGVGNVPSEGLKKGSIIDIDDTVKSIRRAVEQAERMIGMEIRQVFVGIPAHHARLIDCHGVVAVSGTGNNGNRIITNEDVDRVMDAAQVMAIPQDRIKVNILPKQFIVDDQQEISDPRGMSGVRLELEGILVTGSKTMLYNILRCVEKAGLQIIDIVLQPIAAGEIALSKDEKNLGAALIDIGGGSTTVTYFEDGIIQGTSVIPIGGDNITKDISIVLRTSSEDAERVKLKYGHAYFDLASENEVFHIPVIGSNQKQEFNQLELSEIIEARLAEILELAQGELRKMGADDLPGGYVLTGGTSNLQGVLELAQDIFQNRVRIAIPDYIGVREPQYTTAVGIIKYAYKIARFSEDMDSEPVVTRGDYYDQKPVKTKSKQHSEVKMSTKIKNFFGSFFE